MTLFIKKNDVYVSSIRSRMALSHLQMNQHSKLDIVDEKYQQTLIYGIVCLITGEMYVGSTIQTLKERIAGHIQMRNCRAIQILDRGNYKAYEIQRWPCNTLREKLTLEGGWQRAYKASFGDFLVNRSIEGTFQNDSPEAKREYKKQWHEEHRDERLVQKKQYYKGHKEEAQAYAKEHKEEKLVYAKQRNKKPWTCEWCDMKMTIGSKYRHKKRCKSKPSE